MQPNPSSAPGEPVIEVLEDIVPAALHTAAWATCMGKGWYYGHSSTGDGWSRFWKMDLDGDSAFDAIWEHARARCETLAGGPLRVIRQYANGHTYGQGGNPHRDDSQPGSFTLLYYPNPEWKQGWDGETVFYDGSGEIALAVRPRPNRAVLFDSRIPHAGRAPSRTCPMLRVTVAYKLELATRAPAAAHSVGMPALVSAAAQQVEEAGREGAGRTFRGRVAASVIQAAVDETLASLGNSVRLPGFRPGHIPREVLEKRYGAQARVETLKRFAAEMTNRGLPEGTAPSSCELVAGAESGDLEVRIHATHLPDLPAPDFSQVEIEKLTAEDDSAEAAAFLRGHVKSQVLERLDAAYQFPVLPGWIEQEFAAIRKQAGAQGEGAEELRAIAERRLRLGLLLAEMGRRFGMEAANGAEVEERVIDRLLEQARVREREISPEELRRRIED